MTPGSAPRTRSITIDRLDIHVSGVDASTVQAALNALPSATASALLNDGVTAAKLGMRPSAEDVAQAIAVRIATHCRAAELSDAQPLRAGARSFASLRMTPASLRMTADEVAP